MVTINVLQSIGRGGERLLLSYLQRFSICGNVCVSVYCLKEFTKGHLKKEIHYLIFSMTPHPTINFSLQTHTHTLLKIKDNE